MAIRPSSAKAKGRKAEKECVADVMDTFPELEEGDVLPSHSSASGMDMLLSPRAKKFFPYAVESKKQKTLSIPMVNL